MLEDGPTRYCMPTFGAVAGTVDGFANFVVLGDTFLRAYFTEFNVDDGSVGSLHFPRTCKVRCRGRAVSSMSCCLVLSYAVLCCLVLSGCSCATWRAVLVQASHRRRQLLRSRRACAGTSSPSRSS